LWIALLLLAFAFSGFFHAPRVHLHLAMLLLKLPQIRMAPESET
jgi:hypothetical protein